MRGGLANRPARSQTPALGALLLLVCVHMFAALSTTPASLSADADAVESVRILLVGNPGPCASP